MTKKIIVAMTLDVRFLTLYAQDGETIRIPQGDPRVKRIVNESLPVLKKGKSFVEVDVSVQVDEPYEHPNPYKEVEEKSGGLVRFFRVAKKAIAGLFKSEEQEPEFLPPDSAGVIPTPQPAPASAPFANAQESEPAPSAGEVEEGQAPVAEEAEEETGDDVVDTIMKNAIPASSKEFSAKDLQQPKESKSNRDEDRVVHEDTVVAVVEGKVIPGMESLNNHFAHAIMKMGNVVGVTNFLKRISAVIDQRNHSIQDLLKFMERGDLPIADDGSIIIYKILRSTSVQHEGQEFTYVDCHTKKVPQRVGTYVFMNPSLVDPNRRNECSNGLHVARRGYLGNFSGDVCVMAKVNPEDVIAVPSYDASKMRVCGYHIIYELPSAAFQVLKQDKAMTGHPEAAAMLQRAIEGNHVKVIDRVEITGQHGTGIKVTLGGCEEKRKRQLDDYAPVEGERGAEAVTQDVEEKAPAAPVDPKAIASKQVAAKEQGKSLRQVMAQDLYSQYQKATGSSKSQIGLELLQFKKKAKVAWAKLGLPDLTEELKKLEQVEAVAKTLPKTKPAADKFPAKGKGVHKDPQPQQIPKPARVKPETKAKPAAKKAPAKGSVLEVDKTKSTAVLKDAKGTVRAKVSVDKVVTKPAAKQPPKGNGPAFKIQAILNKGTIRKEDAEEVVKIKKAAKKSWAALGVDEAQVKALEKILG